MKTYIPLILSVFLLGVPCAQAEIVATINSVTTTNSTDYIIASDATNPDPSYNRHAIHAKSNITFTRAGGTDTYDYQLRFQLLNEANSPVLLKGGGLDATIIVDRAVLGSTGAVEDVVDLEPLVSLTPLAKHRVKVTLFRRPSGVGDYLATGLSSTDAPKTWRHFTSTATDDASYNVIPLLKTTSWTRPWALDSSSEEDAFLLTADWEIARYDGFGADIPFPSDITFQLMVELRRVSDNGLVPLEQSTFEIVESVDSFLGGLPIRWPKSVVKSTALAVEPIGSLSSASETYVATVTLSHFASPGAGTPTEANANILAAERLMHFNGTMRFAGGVKGNFSSLGTPAPTAGATSPTGLAVSGLRVEDQSGTIDGLANFSFGDGTALSVTLEDDGDAIFDNGSLQLTGPTDQFIAMGNMRYQLKNVVVGPGGLSADIALLLPTGLGWTTDPSVTRIWESELVFEGLPYADGSFLPADGALSIKGTRWFSEESKPVWFETSEQEWHFAQSRLTFTTTGEAAFVRGAELTQLLADTDVPAGDRSKRSNDHVYHALTGANGGSIVVDADTDRTARMTAEFALGGSFYFTHFPYNARVISGSGTLKVTADAVDTAMSTLNNVAPVTLSYAQDCAGDGCPAVSSKKELAFAADTNTLHFTPDGGLVAAGQMDSPEKLQWGKIESLDRFAHETSAFSDAVLHIPGTFSTSLPDVLRDEGPGVLLHSGVDASTHAMVRPDTNAFEEGAGSYAGLNFRTIGGSFTGTSTLGGDIAGPYDLSHRCHYITRYAGVTGIHEAYTGSFPEMALVAGYPMQFEDFGIQLTQSQVTDSRTKGSLDLPEPSDISFAYDKLFFTCLGAPSTMEVAASEIGSDKVLSYWQADIQVKTVGFVPVAVMGCEPSAVTLSVGVEAWSSEIATPLHGTLGFHADGEIQTIADPPTEPAITSRLKLPTNVVLAGPGDEQWAATPVGDAYFNRSAEAPGAVGWLNIAAKIDLPFFADAPVHLHTRCRKDDPNALLYVMGGFHDPAKSFSINGEHYFTQQPFDTAHRGYAAGVSLAQYRDGLGADDDHFQMHAQTRWLNLIDLDYVMDWEPATRSFKDFTETESELLVLSLEHRCRRLTPENADIDFGASAGLPKLSLTELASGQVSKLFDSLQGVIDEEIFNNGREAIEQLLDPAMRELFEGPLNVKMNEQAEAFVADLLSDDYWDGSAKSFKADIDKDFVEGLLNDAGLLAVFQDVIGDDVDVLGLLQEIKDRLTKARAHIAAFRAFTTPDGDNKFDKMATTAKRLAKIASDKLDNPAYSQDIEALVAELKPILIELDTLAAKAEGVCQALLDSLEGNGPFLTEVKTALNGAANELSDAVADVASDVNTLLKPHRDGLDDLTQGEVQTRLRQKIAQAMEDRFLSTGLSASIHQILKQRTYDLEQQMRQVVDGVFEQADEVSREIIESVLGGADEKLASFLGDVNQVMAGAEAKGKAHIRGDSLTDLRLDLKVELQASDKMKAHVFLEIKELNSDNTPGGCLPPGGMGTEVTMGAKEVALEWAYPGLSASFDTRFQFDGDGKLTGMGGALEVLGEIDFAESFTIHEMGCAVMFGQVENYISAEVALSVSKGFKGKGGIFFGRSCTLAPFFWDPTIQDALGEAPFTGAYAYGEAHVALNQILGIPPSCLLNLTAGMGQGVGLFAEGPTGVGKIFYGIEGEVLCLATVTGEVSLTGVLSLADFSPTLVGQGKLRGEVGYCPLCIDLEKILTLTFKDWKLSYKLK